MFGHPDKPLISYRLDVDGKTYFMRAGTASDALLSLVYDKKISPSRHLELLEKIDDFVYPCDEPTAEEIAKVNRRNREIDEGKGKKTEPEDEQLGWIIRGPGYD